MTVGILPNLFRGIAGAAAALVPVLALAGEVRFAPEDGHAYHPMWSVDGKYIAFEVNRLSAGTTDLYVAQVTNGIAKDGLQVKLPGGSSQFGGTTGQVVTNPTWHPGGLVVFEGSNEGGDYRLYIYGPGGASATQLLDTTKAPGKLTFPTISPDGNLVAYISSQTGSGDVRSWNRTTNAFLQHTKAADTESFPQYSKDGKRLIFTRETGGTLEIYELDVASGVEKMLVGGGGDQTRPAYAANGSIVYFTSERGTQIWDIAVVDAAGANKRILAKDVRLPLRARPALSPDGQWVSWVSADPLQDMKVMMARIDGTKTVEIATQFKGCGEPAITVAAGRTYLAYTYLPQSGADWRHLFVQDVTDKL